ncbi:MAG: hypothetical protein ACREJO_04975 [Phycisphaerales bacterium]
MPLVRYSRPARSTPRPPDRSRCPVCGYKTGLAPGRSCPECGETLEANTDGFRRQSFSRRQRVWAGIIGVILIAIVMLLPILWQYF